ncbi:MAG: SurA N-terminal domain-containing protein [Sedimentisphaerales bacterium]|nr:SurA N-terminal domain-containing protein [Sedimentisphaerales bacterium]
MHTHRRNLIMFTSALFFAIMLFLLPADNKNKDPANDKVIALVNGEKILSSDRVKITKIIEVMNLYQLKGEALNKAVRQYEVNALIANIRQTITRQKIAELGLSVSDKEVQSKVEEIFKTIDNNSANEIIRTSNATYEALQAWQKDPSMSDNIYKELLAPLNTREEDWELLKLVYDTPEELTKMQVPKTIEDMKKFSFESARNDLLYQKLIDNVTKVTVTEDEIKEAYNLKYGDWNHESAFDEVKDKIREQLIKEEQSAAFTEWLNEQYNKAKIEIKDQRYKEVLNILRTGIK